MTEDKPPTKHEHPRYPEYVDFCFDWQMANKSRKFFGQREKHVISFEEFLKLQKKDGGCT